MKKVTAIMFLLVLCMSAGACGEKAGESNGNTKTETSPATTEIPAILTKSPTQPTEAPTDLTEVPTQPTETPVEVTKTPIEPTKVPAEPTETPIEVTETPAEATKTPAKPTEAPVEATKVPEEPTKAPAEPTKVPVKPIEAPAEPTKAPVPSTEEKSEISVDVKGITTTDELEDRIEKHLDELIESLYLRWEALAADIDTYDKYCKDSDRVTAFYETVIDETNQMCVILYEYSAVYARMILDSDLSAADKYNAMDDLNDCLYNGACDEIKDEIYDGILNEMNEYFYNGIIGDASDDSEFSKWYDVASDEYGQWYDTSSEVYSLYYDTASDIYSFYFDMSLDLFSRDFDKTEKVYDRFLKKIRKLKGIEEPSDLATGAKLDTAIRSIASIEDVESIVQNHVSECIQLLDTEWATLSTEINTYSKYMEKVETIEAFHTWIEDITDQILTMICEYGISYAELIMQSDLSNREKYNAFEDLKDCIYDDVCELVKDEIYDGLLVDVKEYYYEGIIYDEKDNIKYSDWLDTRSDAYEWWLDTRSEVYENWLNTRSDIYGFWLNIRSELYSADSEAAMEELQDFKDKVTKME